LRLRETRAEEVDRDDARHRNRRRPNYAHIRNGATSIGSIFKDGAKDDDADDLYDAAIDGIESLLLALAHEGVNLGALPVVRAIETAVEACANNLV
jgi:hypothetical protein